MIDYFGIFFALFFAVVMALPVMVWVWQRIKKKFNFTGKLIWDDRYLVFVVLLLSLFIFAMLASLIPVYQDIMYRISTVLPLINSNRLGLFMYYLTGIFFTYLSTILIFWVIDLYRTKFMDNIN